MSALDRFITWVRAGYPNGVPDQDYVPLMALLRRRLTDDEVDDLGRELQRNGIIPDGVAVGAGILKRTQELPTPEEMRRVSSRLQSGGWPVEPADPS